ncbi:DEAD/DEAH box helicase [Rhodococcus aetherivorans]|uniref:DEAD/DEAH box helicase n=1 Tax=Rhodococcus aetherivorans TaxID=191292 RepID=UPI001E3D56B0|nr:DEAD/DEAH box helicase [Rhodococcus aetherivorans]UGQ39591.1 DEAD/DEAH box helicase [Rhodococcus aetherivorans]
MLSPGQAQKLVDELEISRGSKSDPYSTLDDLRISKGSSIEVQLHHLLGVPYEPPPSKEQGSQDAEDIHPAYQLFPHQRQAATEANAALSRGRRRVVLHMPTGSGKTRTAMSLIADYLRAEEPRMAVWLAYSEELCDQAANEFEQAWAALGNRPAPVLRFWGGNPISLDGHLDGLVVCSLDKIRASMKSDYMTWSRLADRARLIVIDEAHQALAPTYKQTLELLVDRHPETSLLGLTATPGRTWNDLDEDEKLANFFDRKKVSLKIRGYQNPVDYLVAEGYLANAKFEPLTYTGRFNLDHHDLRRIALATDIPSGILDQLAEDDARTLLILMRAESLIATHRRLIIFATTTQHSDTLAAVLAARGVNAASVTSATHPIERRRLIKQFRTKDGEHRVLCNFGVLTTGFDAPEISAAIIARPTKSLVLYSQMVGRATRGIRAGGNAEALIVTVVDTSLPGFGDMSEAFTNWEDVWSTDERN